MGKISLFVLVTTSTYNLQLYMLNYKRYTRLSMKNMTFSPMYCAAPVY